MRASANEPVLNADGSVVAKPNGDPFHSYEVQVFMDDMPLDYCIAADEKAGTAEVIRMQGNRILRGPNGEPLVDVRRGRVKLQLTPVEAMKP